MVWSKFINDMVSVSIHSFEIKKLSVTFLSNSYILFDKIEYSKKVQWPLQNCYIETKVFSIQQALGWKGSISVKMDVTKIHNPQTSNLNLGQGSLEDVHN